MINAQPAKYQPELENIELHGKIHTITNIHSLTKQKLTYEFSKEGYILVEKSSLVDGDTLESQISSTVYKYIRNSKGNITRLTLVRDNEEHSQFDYYYNTSEMLIKSIEIEDLAFGEYPQRERIYDKTGKLTKETFTTYVRNCNCSTVYHYDDEGYLVRKDEFDYEDGSLGFTTYLNDEHGYAIEIKDYSSENEDPTITTLIYTYDEYHNPTKIVSSDGNVIESLYSYYQE